MSGPTMGKAQQEELDCEWICTASLRLETPMLNTKSQ